MKKETLTSIKNKFLQNLKDDFLRLKNPVTAVEVLDSSFISAVAIINFALIGLPKFILSSDAVSKLIGAIILLPSPFGIHLAAKSLAGKLHQKKSQ